MECGVEDTKYHHGVAFCTNTACHPMRAFNRDIIAAKKIAARTFAELRGLDLGPWTKDTILDGIPSSALVEAQICYITQMRLRGPAAPLCGSTNSL